MSIVTIGGVISVEKSLVLPNPAGFKKELYDLPSGRIHQFSLNDIEQWYHPKQKNGGEVGWVVFYELQKKQPRRFENSLNRKHGAALRKKGVRFHSEFFSGEDMPFWGSISEFVDGIYVSCNHADLEEDEVVEIWKPLSDIFTEDHPTYHLVL